MIDFVTLGRLLTDVLSPEWSFGSYGGMYIIQTTPVPPDFSHNIERSLYDKPLSAILRAIS